MEAGSNKGMLVVPILMIAVGIGWLLSTLNIIPEINWIWTAGLAAAGFLPFALGGLDKVNIVVGLWFLSASVLPVLHQSGKLFFDAEVPILVIIVGVLMIIACSAAFPSPSWLIDDVSQAPRPKED